LKNILGLVQNNYRFMNQTYNTDGFLVSGDIKLYNSANDCKNDVNPFKTYRISAQYLDGTKLMNYDVTEV